MSTSTSSSAVAKEVFDLLRDDLLAIEGIDDEAAGKIIELARQHEEVEETAGGGEEAEGEEGEAVAEEAQPGEEKPEEAQVE